MMVELEELVPVDLLVLLEQWWKAKRCLDLLGQQDLMEPLECLGILDLKEKWEREEIWDPGDLLVKMVFKGHLDCRASRAELEILVNQVYKVRRETLALVGKWDLLAFKELLDFQASQASKEFLVCQGTREPLEERVTLAHLVLMARMVLMVKMVLLDSQETEESLEKMEAQVSRV